MVLKVGPWTSSSAAAAPGNLLRMKVLGFTADPLTQTECSQASRCLRVCERVRIPSLSCTSTFCFLCGGGGWLNSSPLLTVSQLWFMGYVMPSLLRSHFTSNCCTPFTFVSKHSTAAPDTSGCARGAAPRPLGYPSLTHSEVMRVPG